MSDVAPSIRRFTRRGPAGWIWLGIVLLLVGAFAFTLQFVDPPPPKVATLATGDLGGRYRQFGEALQRELAGSGLEIELRSTTGSAENLALLADRESGVSLGIVQSGLASRETHPNLRGLAVLFHEPIWVFIREAAGVTSLRDLEGRAVAVGKPGSGTLPVAHALLKSAGLDDVIRREIGGREAVEALRNGQVDGAVFVVSVDSELVWELFHMPGVLALPFRNAEAFSARHRFMSAVTVAPGLVDIEADQPRDALPLLAANAMLVARADLHPALTPLLLQACRRVLRDGGLLEPPGRFPAAVDSLLDSSPEALHFHESGPPFLQRYMPFRIASLLDRMKILLLPIVTLLIPIIRLAGPTWRWRARLKVLRWYRVLRDIDMELLSGKVRDPAAEIENLERVRREIRKLRVPLSYTDTLFQLQQHIDMVLARLREELARTLAITDKK